MMDYIIIAIYRSGMRINHLVIRSKVMRLNEKTHITGDTVLLVPYEKEHVEKYHEWMKSEELQQLTASEPLPLQEEFLMQKSWREDANKCTFIILDKETFDPSQGIQGQIGAMAGDVNFFLNDEDDRSSAEVEIMIAESSCRGKGKGREALLAMIRYGIEYLNLKTITGKIGFENQASLNLFTKLGFTEISRSGMFKEITLHLVLSEQTTERLYQLTNHLRIENS